MATFNDKRKGWEWSQQEREDRKDAVRRMKSQVDKLAEQVSRIKAHLPVFGAAAQKAFKAVTDSLSALVGLNITNRGPKYHDLSPQEADRLLEGFPQALRIWRDFTESPAFAMAARRKNSDIHTQNRQIREHNKVVAAANAATWDRMDEILRMAHDSDIGGALDQAAKHGLL